VSGVSVDEEMSNLMLFQKAFQASARLISMTDELLSTIIQM
jgi:flagellar hook-associated protein 1 FlgK